MRKRFYKDDKSIEISVGHGEWELEVIFHKRVVSYNGLGICYYPNGHLLFSVPFVQINFLIPTC